MKSLYIHMHVYTLLATTSNQWKQWKVENSRGLGYLVAGEIAPAVVHIHDYTNIYDMNIAMASAILLWLDTFQPLLKHIDASLQSSKTMRYWLSSFMFFHSNILFLVEVVMQRINDRAMVNPQLIVRYIKSIDQNSLLTLLFHLGL